MKILLLGDFSSLHTHLSHGLRENGHHVDLYSNGDGWKQIPGDFRRLSFFDNANNVLKKVFNLVYQFIIVLRLSRYDIIQIISPYVFSNSRFANLFFNILRRKSKHFSYVACGTDPYYIQSAASLEYFPLSLEERNKIFGREDTRRMRVVLQNVDVVRPSAYDYFIGYKGRFKNLGVPFFLPVERKEFTKLGHYNGGRLRIYHGITRAKFKGSEYFIDAMLKLKSNYPNDVEVVIKERLSYNEFLEELHSCHIFLDQCNSYGFGMNAVLAASLGKIVLTGAEKAALGYLGVNSSCPFINACPDSNQIYKQLEMLLDNDYAWHLKQSKAHFEYVTRFHDRNVVANQFIDFFVNNNDEK